MSSWIDDRIKGVQSVAITGHVNPDGDCLGSCCGLFSYIKDQYPEVPVDLYLEEYKPVFGYLKGADSAKNSYKGEKYDVIFFLDASAVDRIGVSEELLHAGNRSYCIDHHVSNEGFADENVIEPDASSASEVLYTLLDPAKISVETATAIYTGIIHDTGVFQYNTTSLRTMTIAGEMMEKGIPFTSIIQNPFYSRTYGEAKTLGLVLNRMELLYNGKCALSYISAKEMEEYCVAKAALDGISSQMKLTRGVEIAAFVYPDGEERCKLSLRSTSTANVSRIAMKLGGGGHVRAAGCTLHVPLENAREIILPVIEKELREKGFIAFGET